MTEERKEKREARWVLMVLDPDLASDLPEGTFSTIPPPLGGGIVEEARGVSRLLLKRLSAGNRLLADPPTKKITINPLLE